MGFLNWLFGVQEGPTVTSVELIWLTEAAMLNGLTQQIRELQAQGQRVLLLGHFSDDMGVAVEALQAAGIEFRPWKPSPSIENAIRELQPSQGVVWMAKVDSLPAIPEDDQTFQPQPAQQNLSLLVFHHHPEVREDERVLNFAVRIPVDHITCLTSLDHPLIRRFAGSNIQQMLRSLGMKESETIESPLVHRQINRAQQRIAQKVGVPQYAESADEWFDLNMPN